MPNWSEVLNEVAGEIQQHQQAVAALQAQINQHAIQADLGNAISTVRRRYLSQLHSEYGRNVIAYYSGYLSKPGIAMSSINDEDKNGFMMVVHKMGKKRMAGLDLILHTPGGVIESTQSIIRYLREMFGDDIRAIVPQIAMSAGTMIALSCKEIWMGKHSNLGPINPLRAGLPAAGFREEFKRAWREVKKDPGKIPLWQVILGQYKPTLLDQCDSVIQWSNKFVTSQLETVMFAERDAAGKIRSMTPAEKKSARTRAQKVVSALSDLRKIKTHGDHIHAAELQKMGLKVFPLEQAGMDKFQDLVLTIHHCYMHTMMNTTAYKIVENHLGDTMVKHIAPQQPIPAGHSAQPNES